MTASDRHRGKHPRDDQLFGADVVPVLREAVADLSWLLGRGYATTASADLVGDRFQLRKRQRVAIARAAASDAAVAGRSQRRVDTAALAGQPVALDGLNCIIAVEAALSGGVLLVGRDGAVRDMSSVHGSYRRVDETAAAASALGEVLADASVAEVHWLLDRPVSNSGRLKAHLAEQAEARGWRWNIELVDNPDRTLVARDDWVVASGDAWVLDHCTRWVDLSAAAIARAAPDAWLIDLRD